MRTLPLILCLSFAAVAAADSVDVPAARDNTLIETVDGSLSNGAGSGIFCGRTGFFGNNSLRRAVIAFDVGAHLPPGSTVLDASITLFLTQSGSAGAQTCRLHRLTADWGEGTSSSPGGVGAPSTPGDATWLHTFWADAFWTFPGGDFVITASASQTVGTALGPVTWTSPQLASDLQGWVDDPAGNFGWIVIGNESGTPNTAKRFASRENDEIGWRPVLTIEFDPPVGTCDADLDGSGAVNVADLLIVVGNWGGPGGDVTGDGTTNVADLLAVLSAWGDCP